MDLSPQNHIVKAAPAQYVSQSGVIRQAGAYLAPFAKNVLLSGGRKALRAVGDTLKESLKREGIRFHVHRFSGESTEANVERLMDAAKRSGAEAIVAIGGGKSIDTAKMAADRCGIPVACIPTIAATCAATTPMAIIYNEQGEYLSNYYLRSNPLLVLVDPAVIIRAPEKYLVSGILDALAKWYEGSASMARAENADLFDRAALALAQTLNTWMKRQAAAALQAIRSRQENDALLDVINLNIYYAGVIQSLGVKNVRNGIAHATHNGLTVLHESHRLTHGVKVGYGIAVQLFLLNNGDAELRETYEFFQSIGFLPSFREMRLPFNEETVHKVAEKTIRDPLMASAPFNEITKEQLVEAMQRVESFSL